MSKFYLTNSLNRKKEIFIPLNPPKVGMYSCGPTVYDYSHIGHLRRYVGDDILKRVLKLNGYKVKHVMNVTDVGHLTSDADTGEDKIEKKARQQGKSAWEIAKYFEDQFFTSTDSLNIERPDIVSRATDHIKEQIALVKKLENKKVTYKTEDGIYFDSSKIKGYGKLAGEKRKIKPGARIDIKGKKNPTDFALWKFSNPAMNRQMEWESPWGVGFPGWHIECSAMSMKYLGDSFDIHTGGVDHLTIHHPNEIAQAETASGKTFVKYWVHHEFLKVEGKKMSKSLKNLYTIEDIEKKKFDPLALRYLFMTTHYKDSQNFTWDSLKGAQVTLDKLRSLVAVLRSGARTMLSNEKNQKTEKFGSKFTSAVNDDLNTPRALAVLWEALKSNIPSEDKYDLVISFDEVLGLKLGEIKQKKNKVYKTTKEPIISPVKLSLPTIARIGERQQLRKAGEFDKADSKRLEIRATDKIRVKDTAQGTVVEPVQDEDN